LLRKLASNARGVSSLETLREGITVRLLLYFYIRHAPPITYVGLSPLCHSRI